MSRFQYTDQTRRRFPPLLGLVFSAAVLVLCLIAIHRFSAYSSHTQLESLERTLQRNIVQCYALEGAYPPSDTYLEEQYGFVYDKSRFYVDYKSIGANIYPDVMVLERKGR